MHCDHCNKRKARIHLTDIKDGEKKELDLCEVCAKELGIGEFLGVSDPSAIGGLGREAKEALPDKICSRCGISFKEFAEKGRLGCQHDYEAFAAELAPIIKQLHQAERHRGKVPSRLGAASQKESILSYLQEELARAIEKEQYERAAEVRDRIIAIEKETDATN